MNKELKELIIYIVLLLAVPAILIAIPAFLEELEIPCFGILCDINPIIFIMVIALLVLISPILTTAFAIRKAKGKYLRNFFDDLRYSTVGFVFIALALTSKHFFEVSELYIIPFCYSIIFTIIFGLINKRPRKILAFFTYLTCSTILMPMILSCLEEPGYIKDILYSMGYIYISVYLVIFIYNVRKFIKSKVIKINK